MLRDTPSRDRIPALGATEQLRVLATVLSPPVLKGPIVRRPRAVDLAERLDLDSGGVATMQRLRARHGSGPVRMTLAGRQIALLLDPADVRRVLDGTPEPFTPATLEKRGALGHFEPRSVLVSGAAERRVRRPLNERVLETGRPVHSHGEAMTAAIQEEVASLLGHADFTGALDWDGFITAWWRIVRRIVLGDGARDDHRVSDDLHRLRSRGNLSYFLPRDRRLRRRFLDRLQEYVDRAEPGSLAALVAADPAPEGAAPVEQIPQWLFAFDAAAWASFRALSLLTSHPGAGDTAREEMARAPELPFLRAAVLESLRLWPTTPLLLRDTTEETAWAPGTLPTGTGVLIFAPYFHRDEQLHGEKAHRFSPELWADGVEHAGSALVPFSGGPGMCPGRDVVLLTSSMMLGELLRRRSLTPRAPLRTDRLPGTLSPFSAVLDVAPRA
jgi:cytochrome P450